MAKKQAVMESSSWSFDQSDLWRLCRAYLIPVTGSAVVALTLLVMVQHFDAWLMTSDRFLLATTEVGVHAIPAVQVAGGSPAVVEAVRRQFNPDAGRSVFTIPIEERRRAIERIPWVWQAAVSRVWPDRIIVRVVERTPVAYVPAPANASAHAPGAMYIDAEGLLLPIQNRTYRVPVLNGVTPAQAPEERARRVRLMQRLLTELGPHARSVSEIDVRDVRNLKVLYPTENRGVLLMLGGEQWKYRMEKFLHHYPEIRERMPNAIELDLRPDDRILATEVDNESDGD